MGPKLKSFCTAKETINMHRMGGNISKIMTDKETISKIYKQLMYLVSEIFYQIVQCIYKIFQCVYIYI